MFDTIAEFTTKDGKKVEIMSAIHRDGPYTVFQGDELKQLDLSPADCIRYLCHRLEGK